MALTNSDLSKIEKIFDSNTKEYLKEYMTRDEFHEKFDMVMTAIDGVMGELKDEREERDMLHYRVYDNHEERITVLEQPLPIA